MAEIEDDETERSGKADPQAAAELVALVLISARALRETIRDGLRPVSRERLLEDLERALAPFEGKP